MASSTLSLCSSFASHLTLTHKQTPSSFPSTSSSSSLSFFPRLPSHSTLSFRSTFSPRLPFPSLPKSSDSDAAVAQAEPQSSELEAVENVQLSPEGEAPKREQIFAVVMIGSRQYIVFPGRFIYTQRLKGANVNDKITLNKVLLVGTRTTTYIGKPVVTNAVVHATVEEQGLDSKVIVFKYKKKKKYRRNIGHRQKNAPFPSRRREIAPFRSLQHCGAKRKRRPHPNQKTRHTDFVARVRFRREEKPSKLLVEAKVSGNLKNGMVDSIRWLLFFVDGMFCHRDAMTLRFCPCSCGIKKSVFRIDVAVDY
ncbi:50S ribosomal protein L21, chloroplastic-like [Senna tora]|uniref:50S ribosomal protein L21, chloroplastic-like n=1 Tax=Senna tora TaxID=362788 RepID=A0A834WHZ9_9FABA|nr:50S ribosomal protein L21, chloroplastic-like [Senna tora]